jgi:hypothetical protein
LVIAAENRIYHDFTDLNRVTVRDAHHIIAMAVILSRFAGKGMFSIGDADRGFSQIMNTLETAVKAAFEYIQGRSLDELEDVVWLHQHTSNFRRY